MPDIYHKFYEKLNGIVSHPRKNDPDNQACAFVDEGEKIYFLMTSESEGRCHRLEFWVDTYAENRWTLQKNLQEFVSRNLLTHELVSYYSAIGCRLRQRTDDGHIADDITRFKDDVYHNILKVDVRSDVKINRAEEEPLILPCQRPLNSIASMLDAGSLDEAMQDANKNRLVIPPIQRGKVWNAARIEALWDSIFREIPIGALSVRKQAKDERALDLLDGQQRSSAVALGFANFPNHSRRYDSILWIDLDANKEGEYRFFVTTASQPWGYADTASETKNTLLPLDERRVAAESVKELEEDQIKPYPYQLYPFRASAPVPYTLLNEFVKIYQDGRDVSTFVKWLEGKVNPGLLKKLLERVGSKVCEGDAFGRLCKLVADRASGYPVFLLDASSVAEKDIALYFTRIGKGGVVPTDEELAYSVLKSKLEDKGFRDTIEHLHEQYGIATQSRIAHLAVRFYKSRQKEGGFYSGSVFSAVADMCKDEDDKASFLNCVKGEFQAIIAGICAGGKTKLTRWHLTRYAKERNGDVFLFLMLANRGALFADFNLDGIAELLFGYASQTDYAIRKILDEGLQIGLARLLNETYYNVPRFTLPINPDVYNDLDVMTHDKVPEWKEQNSDAAAFMSQGYGGSPNDRSLSILIYACRNSELNHKFEYDKQLGIWSEENCPWDYDHIMPHSTIENIENTTEQAFCDWLKNSIGNIAPIPFSINRSLSDLARDGRYPYCDEQVTEDEVIREQGALCVEGADIAGMWSGDGKIVADNFIHTTMVRFVTIYRKWYDDLEIDRILNFELGFDQDTSRSRIRDEIVKRFVVFQSLRSAIDSSVFQYAMGNGRVAVVPESERHRWFAAADRIDLVRDATGLEVAAYRRREGGNWVVGLRKMNSEQQPQDDIRKEVDKVFGQRDIGDGEKVTICKDDREWYSWDEIEDCDNVKERIERRMKALLSIWQARGEGCLPHDLACAVT